MITSAQLAANPKLCPVRISADIFGEGTSSRDLIVSCQHRILIEAFTFDQEIGVSEALILAKDLIVLDGVDIIKDLEQDIVYYHILCKDHEVIYAEDMLAESMLTGMEALKSLNDTDREEVEILMPELLYADYVPTPARTLFAGKKARNAIRSYNDYAETMGNTVHKGQLTCH